ncbi:hypothetical protein ACJX0J_012174, partial [Zea mays]
WRSGVEESRRPVDGHQLRADRGQPAVAGEGVVPGPVDAGEQGEAVRRGPVRAERVRRHGCGVRGGHRQRERVGDGGAGGGAGVGGAARAAVPPGHAHHLHHRRQRGAQGQRQRAQGEPPAGHAVRVPGADRGGPAGPGERHHGALAGHHGQHLPALRRRVRPRRRALPPAAPGLPVRGAVPVPHQLLPLLRVQGRPGQRAAGVRPVPARRRRGHRRQHGAQVRQHAVRPGRLGVRRHPEAGPHRRRRQGLRDRVAVQGGPRRGRRHAGVRQDVHRQPAAEDRDGAGHADEAVGARRRLRVRALQREPQARPGLRTELRLALPRRHARVRCRPAGIPSTHGLFTRHQR